MRTLLRDEWLADERLKHFRFVEPKPEKYCLCDEKSEHIVELIDHESCIVGRIDSVVCTKCNAVKSFKIIR